MDKILLVFALLILIACGGSSTPPTVASPPNNTGGGNTNTPVIALQPIFTNLSFNQPLAMFQAPGNDTLWYVMERAGRIRVFSNNSETNTFNTDFIDIRSRVNTSGEGGLLGMAFHPDFAINGHVYLSWTQTGTPLVSIVSRFTTNTGGASLNISSEQEILRLNQDFTNHNGGNLAFGADGYLYIGFGDGGSGGDPNDRAENTTNLLGSLLRIDINSTAPYSILADNPFFGNPLCSADPNVSVGNCPEIFAWGLRNPWRWSFDLANGSLWLADVGQGAWEEINLIVNGGNYGWDNREGAHCHEPVNGCSSAGLIDPVAEYGHELGNSITGGYVYRGLSIPELFGQYLFADFGSGRIWRLLGNTTDGFNLDELLDTDLSIASFAQGNDGEIYVLDIAGGGLYQIVSGN